MINWYVAELHSAEEVGTEEVGTENE